MNITKERHNRRINTDTTQVLITYSAIVTSIIAFLFLPQQVTIKLIPSDLLNDGGAKTQIFILPLLVFLLGVVVTFRPKTGKAEQESRKPYVLFVRVITVLMTLILGVQLLYAFGVTFALTILNAFIGAAMIFVGVRVRRGKKRLTFRVRTKWTIKYQINREATEKLFWQAAVILGVSQLAIAVLFPDYIGLASSILFIIVWLFGTIIYSTRYHRTHLAQEASSLYEGPIREDKRNDD